MVSPILVLETGLGYGWISLGHAFSIKKEKRRTPFIFSTISLFLYSFFQEIMYNSKRNGIITNQRAQYNNWCNNRKLSASNVVTPTPLISRVAQDNNLRSFPLPPELLLEVFGYLSDCQSALHSASLVCKQWMYCAAPILYSHPQINDTYRWATFILTLTRDRMSFFYGDLIRSIDLSSGKSIGKVNHS